MRAKYCWNADIRHIKWRIRKSSLTDWLAIHGCMEQPKVHDFSQKRSQSKCQFVSFFKWLLTVILSFFIQSTFCTTKHAHLSWKSSWVFEKDILGLKNNKTTPLLMVYVIRSASLMQGIFSPSERVINWEVGKFQETVGVRKVFLSQLITFLGEKMCLT